MLGLELALGLALG